MAVAQPTQATQTNFGDIVQRGVAGVQRAQALEDQRRQAEYERQQEFEDRYGIDESLFQLQDTEFRTVNDATTEALAQARDRYYDVYKQLQKDPTNVELKKRLGKVRNFVTTMGASHEKMLEVGQNYLKKLEEGTISGVDEEGWREQLEAYDEGRIRVTMDDNDNPQFLFYGKDGNLQKAVKYTELLRGNLIDKVDVRKEVSDLVKGLGGYKKDTPEGMYIRTNEGYGVEQRAAANQWIDAQLEDDARMADLLNQVNGSKKREGFTPQDYQAVRDYLKTEIEGRYTTSDTLKPDQSKLTQARISASRDGKVPTTADLFVAEDADDGGVLMRDNKVILKNKTGVQIDPAKTDERFDEVRYGPDGSLTLYGSNRIKKKGIQKEDGQPATTVEEAAKAEGWEMEFITKQDEADGTITFYYNKPQSTKNEADLNKFAIALGLDGVTQLKRVIDEKLAQKYGPDNLDKFKRGEIRNAEAMRKSNKNTTPVQGDTSELPD